VRGERFVVLGLAHPRSTWFRDVAHWATSAALPVEFVQSMSVAELRANLGSGRAFSAVLVDGGLPGVDRDLLDAARHVGCAVLVVTGPRPGHDWPALGANTVLAPDFDRTALLDALETYSVRVGRGDDIALVPARPSNGWRAPMVAVTGASGAGSSTVAMAVAQGLAADARHGGMTLLADLDLDADQAALHDARDVVPGVVELVDAHRAGQPSADEIRALTFRVPSRGYHLLLGLRRHRDWIALRPRSFEAAVDGLRRSYSIVVADIDPDLEGEAECGSVDVEERNLMARTVASMADVTVIVGQPGLKGTLGLVRVVNAVLQFGVPSERVVTAVNRSPRAPKARAELSRALAELTARGGPGSMASPVFLPERRHLETIIRDVAPLPGPLVSPVTAAVQAVLAKGLAAAAPTVAEPARVAPGSLGSWTDAGADDELTR
jgi:hypothetical protein